MTTEIDYALMAGASYISTRRAINRFPIPQGWTPFFPVPDPSTSSFPATDGFEAVSFQKGNDIVISFAGTYDTPINPLTNPDLQADVGLATGFGSAQLLQAAEYYLQVKAANPGATITLTGHSLGGGLAALIGVFFNEFAVTFDQAPFAKSAESGLLPPDVAANLKDALLANGYSAAALSELSGFLQLRQQNGGIPRSHLVTTTRVEGEFLSVFPFGLFDPIGSPATLLKHGPTDVAGTELHAQSLLTAFLQERSKVPESDTFPA